MGSLMALVILLRGLSTRNRQNTLENPIYKCYLCSLRKVVVNAFSEIPKCSGIGSLMALVIFFQGFNTRNRKRTLETQFMLPVVFENDCSDVKFSGI